MGGGSCWQWISQSFHSDPEVSIFEKYGGEQNVWVFVESLIEKLVTNRLTK